MYCKTGPFRASIPNFSEGGERVEASAVQHFRGVEGKATKRLMRGLSLRSGFIGEAEGTKQIPKSDGFWPPSAGSRV